MLIGIWESIYTLCLPSILSVNINNCWCTLESHHYTRVCRPSPSALPSYLCFFGRCLNSNLTNANVNIMTFSLQLYFQSGLRVTQVRRFPGGNQPWWLYDTSCSYGLPIPYPPAPCPLPARANLNSSCIAIWPSLVKGLVINYREGGGYNMGKSRVQNSLPSPARQSKPFRAPTPPLKSVNFSRPPPPPIWLKLQATV